MVNKFFKHPTEPIEVWPEKKISELTTEMLKTGYQGRKLAEAFEIWSKMLKAKNIVIWFGLSGAMTPVGMRKIISYLIKRRMVDVVVSTGANLYHDVVESLGVKHYLGTHMADDARLRKKKVDRIYDIFAPEEKFYRTDVWIEKQFATTLKNNYPYSSRQVLYLLGKFLNKNAKDKDSIVVSAYRNGVPIFAPAFGDSSLGFSIMFANRRQKKNINVDYLKDVHETSKITERAKQCGAIFIGGGTPKNFIQQSAVIASYATRHNRSLKFAAQICTDLPQWGGLSGATLQEAISWGKYTPNAKMVNCYVDATVALPIIVHALSERFKRLRRNVPTFEWNSREVKVRYENMRL